jgi:hypothetical protein
MSSINYLNFDGRVVAAYLKVDRAISEGIPNWVLQGASLETQCGRLVLVGKSTTYLPDPQWHEGVTVCIPWDHLLYYVIFESIDHYRDAMKKYRPPSRGGGWFGGGPRGVKPS